MSFALDWLHFEGLNLGVFGEGGDSNTKSPVFRTHADQEEMLKIMQGGNIQSDLDVLLDLVRLAMHDYVDFSLILVLNFK